MVTLAISPWKKKDWVALDSNFLDEQVLKCLIDKLCPNKMLIMPLEIFWNIIV
jgi:hypothetical protein